MVREKRMREKSQRFSLCKRKRRKFSGEPSLSAWILLSERCACSVLHDPHNYGTRLPLLLFITSSHPSFSIPPFLLKGFFICLLVHLCTLQWASKRMLVLVDRNLPLCCIVRLNMPFLFSHQADSVFSTWQRLSPQMVGMWPAALSRKLGVLCNTGFRHYFAAWQH